jgi:hypothetical protein
MSNDTSYNLEFRHPKKARLKEVHTYLTEIKPAICELVQRINFSKRWCEEKRLKFLGVKKRSEVITWFTPYSEARFVSTGMPDGKPGRVHVLMIEGWANENTSNVWISGPDGELTDLLARFPDVEIGGEYVDDYGAGSVQGFEKIYKMSREEHEIALLSNDVQNPDIWQGKHSHLSLATRELLLSAARGMLDLKCLRRLIRDGADVNAVYHNEPFLSHFPIYRCETPEELGKAIDLILSAGWIYGTDTIMIRASAVEIARVLGESNKTLSLRRKVATMLLARKLGKGDAAAQLFQDSLKTRDVRGLLASAFLGADFDAEAAEASKADRKWLKQQGQWEDPEE